MESKTHRSLHFSRKSAITYKVIPRVLGYHSVQNLRKQIEKKRDAEAKNTAKTALSAQKAFDAATGQESIAGWYDV